MTKYLRLLFPLVFLASPLLAQRGTVAIPAEAQMDRYPLHSAVAMTAGEMAKLKLHPVVLTEPTQVLNHYRNINRFVLEMLPVGTVALADSAGVIRYKADCVNRLVLPSKCPACLGLLNGSSLDSAAVAKARADSLNSSKSDSALLAGWLKGLANESPSTAAKLQKLMQKDQKPGFWSQVADHFGSIMDGAKSVLSWLLPLLLFLALLALVGFGIWSLFNRNRSGGSGGTTPPTTPNPPAPAPAPLPIVAPPTPVVGPTPPAPTPTPVPPVVSPTSTTSSVPESTPPAPKSWKTFVHVALADGQSQPSTVIRHSDDINSVTYESENGVNTLRFRQW